MIESFFRSLKDNGVEYLLISGQATVLYGAATFSEDVDLWINPTSENSRRFLLALRTHSTIYHKLTPPLDLIYLNKGHGFHFIVSPTKEEQFFLDVMGSPPRVGAFAEAAGRALNLDSDFGQIPTVDLKSLVEIKKTQRLEDYPIISNLILAYFNGSHFQPSTTDYPWAIANIFTLPALVDLVNLRPDIANYGGAAFSDTHSHFFRQLAANLEIEPEEEDRLVAEMQREMLRLQRLDRDYWKHIIAEIKSLRTQKQLMPEGEPV